MRARSLLLVVVLVVVGLLALLNYEELSRPTTLNLGWRTASAPLGLLLLGLFAITLLAFLASSASGRSRHLRESHEHTKALEAQRELADRAEASRFTDLRQQLDSHLRETQQRDVTTQAEMDKSLEQRQREVRNQLEQMHRSLSMRLDEMEARLESRLDSRSDQQTTASTRVTDPQPAAAPHEPLSLRPTLAQAPRPAEPQTVRGA